MVLDTIMILTTECFFRVEGNVMEFDASSLTSTSNSDNKIDMSEINGASGKISIGRSF